MLFYGFMFLFMLGMCLGKYSIWFLLFRGKAFVSFFNEDSGYGGEFKTSRDRKMNIVFGGMYDVVKDGLL